MSVEFTDNTAKIKAALSEGVIGFLHEAGGEIQAQTQRNSRVDTGQTKGSYKYMVDEGKDESTVAVGSDLENAIWEEFGTGEYALHGDGRKGGWVYKSKKDGKFYHTYGKTPRQPLTKAFQSVAPKIKKQLVNVIKCPNPHCICNNENIDHIFKLTDAHPTYRCIYCETKSN